MKIFLDTANFSAIKNWAPTGLIDGVTTNPTNLSSIGGNPKKIVLDICALLPHGHISVEVTEIDPKKMYIQAKKIAALADNIWVKIPCYERYYSTIKKLVEENIKLNITLVFSVLQSLMMCKLGVYYISPFIGRWQDIDVEGIPFIEQMRQSIDFYGFETKILAASVRSVQNMHEALVAGADAVTVDPDIFKKATVHPLTEQGMKQFEKDWKSRVKIAFP